MPKKLNKNVCKHKWEYHQTHYCCGVIESMRFCKKCGKWENLGREDK